MIDWDKPIETVDGIHARVLSRDYIYRGERLTVIQFKYKNHSGIGYYHQNGEPAFGSPEIRNRKTKREGWINISGPVYRTFSKVGLIYETEQEAKQVATDTVVATIKIKWEE